MLRYGIPDYRLPPAVLDGAITQMLSMGATLKTGVALGRDVTLERHGRNTMQWSSRSARGWGGDFGYRGRITPPCFRGSTSSATSTRGEPVKVGEIVAIIGGATRHWMRRLLAAARRPEGHDVLPAHT